MFSRHVFRLLLLLQLLFMRRFYNCKLECHRVRSPYINYSPIYTTYFFVNNMEHCNKRMMFSLSIIDSKIGEVSIRDWALILYVLHQPQSLHLLPMSTFRNIY